MIRTGKTRRSLSVLLSLMTALMLMAGASATGADAAAETVTIKNGGIQYYGSGSAGTGKSALTSGGSRISTGSRSISAMCRE